MIDLSKYSNDELMKIANQKESSGTSLSNDKLMKIAFGKPEKEKLKSKKEEDREYYAQEFARPFSNKVTNSPIYNTLAAGVPLLALWKAIPAINAGSTRTISGITNTLANIGDLGREFTPLRQLANKVSDVSRFASEVQDEAKQPTVQNIAGNVIGSMPIAAKEYGLNWPYALGKGGIDYYAEHPDQPMPERVLKSLTVGGYEAGKRKLLGIATNKIAPIKSEVVRRGLGGTTFAGTDVIDRGIKFIVTGKNQFEGSMPDLSTQFVLGTIFSDYNPSAPIPPLSKIAEMAKTKSVEALARGDEVSAKKFEYIATKASDAIAVNKYGGKLNRAQVTETPMDKLAVETMKKSSWGGTELRTQENLTNPQMVANMSKAISSSPLKGAEKTPANVLIKNITEKTNERINKIQTKIDNAKQRIITGSEQQQKDATQELAIQENNLRNELEAKELSIAEHTQKTSRIINEGVRNATSNASQIIDSIRTDASEKLGVEIPKDPIARSKMFDEQYNPLFDTFDASGNTIDVKPVKLKAGVPPKEKKSAIEGLKELEGVQGLNPDWITKYKTEQKIDNSNVDFEQAIENGRINGFTAKSVKDIVSLIPENPSARVANAARAKLGRAGAIAKGQGNKDASRIFNEVKMNLTNQMTEAFNKVGLGDKYLTINYADNQAKLFDEMNSLFESKAPTGEGGEDVRLLKGKELVNYLSNTENVQDLVNYKKLDMAKLQALKKVGLRAESFESLSGTKMFDKIEQLAKENPEKLKDMFPDNPIIDRDVTRIKSRMKRIDERLEGELKKIDETTKLKLESQGFREKNFIKVASSYSNMAKAFNKNFPKASADLLMNPSGDTSAKIKAVYKTLDPAGRAQMKSYMLEGLLAKTSKIDIDVGGRVTKAITLKENIDKISDEVWNAAFPNNPNVKTDLIQLDRIARSFQVSPVTEKPPTMFFGIERAPIVMGIYGFLRHGSITSLLIGVGAEASVGLAERLVGQWLSNPDTAKLLYQALQKNTPKQNEIIFNKLWSKTNKEQIRQMNTEEELTQ